MGVNEQVPARESAAAGIDDYMEALGRRARAASRVIARAGTAVKNAALAAIAEAIERDAPALRAANARDVERARERTARTRRSSIA